MRAAVGTCIYFPTPVITVAVPHYREVNTNLCYAGLGGIPRLIRRTEGAYIGAFSAKKCRFLAATLFACRSVCLSFEFAQRKKDVSHFVCCLSSCAVKEYGNFLGCYFLLESRNGRVQARQLSDDPRASLHLRSQRFPRTTLHLHS